MIYLELARRQRRWSQSDLGNHPQVRIYKNFISQIERGLALPIPDQAERLARVLGLPVSMLLETVPAVPKDLPVTDDAPAVNA